MKFLDGVQSVGGFVGRWFAVLVIAAAVLGMIIPGQAAPLAVHIPVLLQVIMFGMGLTLRGVDFALVAKRPWAVLIGTLAQFTVMPLAAWGIGQALGLSGPLLIGMILVGSVPGGTASNVVVFLAKGDVALSVALTTVSTLLAPLVTPALVLWLAGSELPVGFGPLFNSIVQVVLIPVAAGVVVRLVLGRFVKFLLPFLPIVSVSGVVLVVLAVVGANHEAILTTGALLVLAVIVHNVLGRVFGYFAAKAAGLDEASRRAVSIEVGMQNSGLAASLATVHFSPLAALPAALFSVWHNVSGALLASFWARRPVASVETAAAAPADDVVADDSEKVLVGASR